MIGVLILLVITTSIGYTMYQLRRGHPDSLEWRFALNILFGVFICWTLFRFIRVGREWIATWPWF